MTEQQGGEGSTRGLLEVLRARLERSRLTDGQQLLVLAAFEGDDQLEQVVQGVVDTSSPTPTETVDQGVKTQQALLGNVTVRGFRGIGAQASLPLQPRPGLTLFLGRNGSGKSTFADGIEIALTGTSYRWKDKTKDWKRDWRNLHEGSEPSVVIELALDGDREHTTVMRTWRGDDVDKSQCSVRRLPGERGISLSDLGWSTSLATYRPFLSYAELGQTVAGRPSDMYDALASILGLEEITAAEGRLNDMRKQLDAAVKVLDRELPHVLAELAALDDERARTAHAALSGRTRRLDEAAAVVAGPTSAEPASDRMSLLHKLAGLTHPDRDSVAEAYKALRHAARDVEAVRGTAAAASRDLADLLDRALEHYRRHDREGNCPVCGSEEVLDEGWAERTRLRVEQLRNESTRADAANQRVRAAVAQTRALVSQPPPWLAKESPVWTAWTEWARGTAIDDPTGLAEHLAQAFPPLRDACQEARQEAAQELEALEDRWRPVALRLGGWIERARATAERQPLRDDLKVAYDWLRDAGRDLRNDRLRPLATKSQEIWQQLRQASNVELGPISLVGRPGTIRRVALDVTVDGVDGTALGVMSQGELHALALALFLPRATMPESPFRFIVIDDPVQSMDPAKVDGLARVLSQAARDRQVIVFTHDARLAEAVRRLELPATVWEVVRRENSHVELHRRDDPAQRALDDGRALVRTATLPDGVALRVVPGFCRSAIEACLVELAWRRQVAAGVRHADIAEQLESTRSTHELAALALFGDSARTGDVLTEINRYGRWAGDTFQACKSAVHDSYEGDLGLLVANTEKLVKRLREP